MGLLGALGRIASFAASAVADSISEKMSNYSDGYDRGSQRAADLSTEELRASLQRAKDNGVSDWKSAGKVRAMADEYKNRTK